MVDGESVIVGLEVPLPPQRELGVGSLTLGVGKEVTLPPPPLGNALLFTIRLEVAVMAVLLEADDERVSVRVEARELALELEALGLGVMVTGGVPVIAGEGVSEKEVSREAVMVGEAVGDTDAHPETLPEPPP